MIYKSKTNIISCIKHILANQMNWTNNNQGFNQSNWNEQHHHKKLHKEQHPFQPFFTPALNVNYKIVSALNFTKVAEVSSNLLHSHQLVLHDFNGHKNQRFHIETQNGIFVFRSLNGQGVLHIPQDSNDDGAHFKVYEPQNFVSQFFQVIPVVEGQWAGKACYLRTFCGKAWQVKGSNTDNNTMIVQNKFTGQANQIWLILPADEHHQQQQGVNPYIVEKVGGHQAQHQGVHEVHNQFISQVNHPYKILPASDISYALHVNKHSHEIHLHSYEGLPEQQFFIEVNNGRVVIKPVTGTGVVHISHNHANDGAHLTVSHPKYQDSEYWTIVPITHGNLAGKAWHIRSFCGKNLDIEEGGQLYQNTPVIQWQNTGSINQTWFIHSV